MGFEKEINTLNQLGLTVCEARVYLALASSGTCSAKKISKISNISSPDVYRVLGRLQERGIIEKVISYPAIFKAVPMEKSLSILFKRKEKEFDALKEKTDRLVCSYKNSKRTESYRDEEHQFVIIPTKGAEIEKRRHLLEITHQSMDVVSSWKRFSKTIFEFAAEAARLPIAAIIYTDIARDGMMTGPNFERTKELIEAVDVPVVASGGIKDISDISKLIEIGAAAAIIGRSLYEGTLNLADAIKAAEK